MRVAIFTETYPPEINGVATSSFTLKTILKRHGHDVLVITTNPYSKKIMLEDDVLRIPGLELKKIYNYRFANIITHNISKYIYTFAPDIIHVQQEAAIGVLGRIYARRMHKPLVYTYHTMYEDYSYYITKGHFDRIVRSILRKFTKSQVENATEFISPSLKTQDYIRLVGADDYINIIPTGIDFSKFNPKNVSKKRVNEIKKKFGINDDDFVLLSLGRIAKEKSVDMIINGVYEYKKAYPDVKIKLLIVGKGPGVVELQKLVNSLGANDYIIFCGPSDPNEVQFYYNAANVFASASITETQGLTYMEAMGSRLYVLARYDFNLLDVIQEDKTGFYFESLDDFVTKLEKIRQLYLNKNENILNNAIEGINRYSIETFYQNIMEVYHRALKKNW